MEGKAKKMKNHRHEIYATTPRGKHLFSIESDFVPRVGEFINCTETGKEYVVQKVHYQLDKQNNIYSKTKNITLIKLVVK